MGTIASLNALSWKIQEARLYLSNSLLSLDTKREAYSEIVQIFYTTIRNIPEKELTKKMDDLSISTDTCSLSLESMKEKVQEILFSMNALYTLRNTLDLPWCPSPLTLCPFSLTGKTISSQQSTTPALKLEPFLDKKPLSIPLNTCTIQELYQELDSTKFLLLKDKPFFISKTYGKHPLNLFLKLYRSLLEQEKKKDQEKRKGLSTDGTFKDLWIETYWKIVALSENFMNDELKGLYNNINAVFNELNQPHLTLKFIFLHIAHALFSLGKDIPVPDFFALLDDGKFHESCTSLCSDLIQKITYKVYCDSILPLEKRLDAFYKKSDFLKTPPYDALFRDLTCTITFIKETIIAKTTDDLLKKFHESSRKFIRQEPLAKLQQDAVQSAGDARLKFYDEPMIEPHWQGEKLQDCELPRAMHCCSFARGSQEKRLEFFDGTNIVQVGEVGSKTLSKVLKVIRILKQGRYKIVELVKVVKSQNEKELGTLYAHAYPMLHAINFSDDFFEREYTVSEALSPHSVKTVLSETHDEKYLYTLTMEYFEGGSLLDFIKTHPDPKTKIHVARETAENLFEFKRKGFVHLSIEPHNVLIKVQEGRLLTTICDYPYVRKIDPSQTIRSFKTMTDGFCPPELIVERKVPVTPSLDVWSLGMTLYCLFYPDSDFFTKIKAWTFYIKRSLKLLNAPLSSTSSSETSYLSSTSSKALFSETSDWLQYLFENDLLPELPVKDYLDNMKHIQSEQSQFKLITMLTHLKNNLQDLFFTAYRPEVKKLQDKPPGTIDHLLGRLLEENPASRITLEEACEELRRLDGPL